MKTLEWWVILLRCFNMCWETQLVYDDENDEAWDLTLFYKTDGWIRMRYHSKFTVQPHYLNWVRLSWKFRCIRISSHEGTNTNAYKLPAKPYPIQVLWLYGNFGMVSHPNATISFIKGLRLMPQHFHHHKPFVFLNTCQNISIEWLVIPRFSQVIFTKYSHLKWSSFWFSSKLLS